MSWSAASLVVLLAATPTQPRRFNSEPVVTASVGLIGVALGAWRLAVADRVYQALIELRPQAATQAEAALILQQARTHADQGKGETAVGAVLLVMGGAMVVASLLWFLLEGAQTTDWLIAPGPGGLSAMVRF